MIQPRAFITACALTCAIVPLLAQDGALDLTFDPGTGANGLYVWHTAEQPDGKIVIGGSFSDFNGTERNNIARLNADGSLDESFDPGSGTNGYVLCVKVLSDGKILIAGSFTTVNGIERNRLARLNSDGSLDTSFDPGAGADNHVYDLIIQPDDRILMAGHFTMVGGASRNRVARLLADGSLDTSFDPGAGANSYSYSAVLQPDGKILLVGQFTTFDGIGRKCIARLTANGDLDTSFNPGTGFTGGTLAHANSAVLQPDGKAIVGGGFTTYSGASRNNIARVNPDGTLDTTFDPGTGFNGDVALHGVHLLPNGHVLIGGLFTTYDGVAKNTMVRLDAAGSLDPDFDCGAGVDNTLHSCGLMADGKIMLTGRFTSFDGVDRNHIARLMNDISTIIPQVAGPNTVVFPNPSSGTFTIASNTSGTISITDITGNVILSDRIQPNSTRSHAIDLSNHPPGTYLAHITGPAGVTSARLIVQ